MQIKKKLNYSLIVKMVFLIFLLAFAFFFYQLYSDFNHYTILKKEPGGKIKKSEILKKNLHFSSSKSKFQKLASFDIFSKGVKSSKTKKNVQINKKDFILLGVVKVGQLYVVIQFKKDKKIRLFPEKSNVNNSNYVEKIGVHNVLIRDESGVIRTHKVFKYEEVKKINGKKVLKFSTSPPLPWPKEEKKKRSQKRNG